MTWVWYLERSTGLTADGSGSPDWLFPEQAPLQGVPSLTCLYRLATVGLLDLAREPGLVISHQAT